MGYDTNSLIKKCGEILMNIKPNKKTKRRLSFTCAFCNTNWDQLKKFSLHLYERHSQQFLDEPLTLSQQTTIDKNVENVGENLEMLLPEIKVEDMALEATTTSSGADGKMELLSNAQSLEEKSNADPLETTALVISRRSMRNKSLRDDDVDKEPIVDDGVMDYEDSAADSSSESVDNNEDNMSYEKLSDVSGMGSDDDRDPEYNINKRKVNSSKKFTTTKNQDLLHDKEITTALLETLEKHPVLWDIKMRTNDKVIQQNEYCVVAEEVNEKLKLQIKWEDVRARIQHIRNEYTDECDKQIKGETFEMPWYAERMKYLEENIQALLKSRDKKRKYRRLSKLDDTHTAILIEYYKNYEILWQVNNIGFVVNSKRREAIKRIIEDLKVKHNIEITVHGMQRRLDYINRLYSADKEQKLKCDLDKSVFVPSSKYYDELTFLGESQGPFKCPHCNDIISSYESYHQHIAKHTNSIPFKCNFCEKRFDKLSKYAIHAKYHLDMKNYPCDICGKIFLYRSSLRLHMYEHTGIEPYLCEICGASFRASNGYDNHIRRHEKRFRYECQICKAGFNHKHSLEAHVKVHLNIRDILCNVCGKGFTAKKHLQRHQLIHSGTKRYKCDICGKAFAQDAGLRAHRKQHIEYKSLAGEARKTAFRKGYYKYNE